MYGAEVTQNASIQCEYYIIFNASSQQINRVQNLNIIILPRLSIDYRALTTERDHDAIINFTRFLHNVVAI